MKNHLFQIVCAAMVLLTAGVVSSFAQSALDGFDPNANGTVHSIAVQQDGKIVIGGEFTTVAPNGGAAVTRNYIARFNPDGTLDTAFNPNANGNVLTIALQPDGRILAGGSFTSINGQSFNYIARLDAATGAPDSSWNPNANSDIFAIALQPDGKILAGGQFTSVGGQSRNYIARLDAATGAADSWNPNPDNQIYSIGVQPDGKIVAGGFFNSIGGQSRNKIARLDAATGAADSWNPSADNFVLTIALQPDGKILAGGGFTFIGGQFRNSIVRLDAATGAADSWNPNAENSVRSIAVQSDGKILAGGGFATIGGEARNNIARLNATTGVADSFDSNTDNLVYSIAVQADGKILLGGAFTNVAPNGGVSVTRNRIARLERDGSLDQTLNLNMVGNYVDAIAMQTDGKIIIGGNFTVILGVSRNRIARLNPDGTLDTAFDPNANNDVDSVAIQSDGKILAGGLFTAIGGQTQRNRIARLNADGSLDTTFNPNSDGNVYSIAPQPNGKILVGGGFTNIGGQTRNNIARLDATGLADSFNPNSDATVSTIIVRPDGKILTAGSFTAIGGQTRNRLARLDPNTGLADSFNPNPNGAVNSIALQTDGNILVGGGFTFINGQPRSRIARVDANGAVDSFNPNVSGFVTTIVVHSDGKILIGGSFTLVNAQPRPNIARLDATTGLPDSFRPNADSYVHSIAVQADGKILIGGNFNNVGVHPRDFFARLSNDIAALQNLAVSQTTIVWSRNGAAPQFSRATFELSTDNVATFTLLGNGTPSLPQLKTKDNAKPSAPLASGYTLTGLNLPANQNILIRARGYYPSGFQNGSETTEELVQSVTLNCPSITVNPASIPGATAGSPYTQVFTQAGGNAPVVFSLSGALPTGLSFTAATATLSGTPTQVGNFPITVTATDANNCVGSRNYTLVIGAMSLVWNGSTSPDWNTASNWTPNAIPATFNDCLIPTAGVTNQPTISAASSSINAMTIQTSRTLTINSSLQLTTAADLTSAGTITGAGKLALGGATFTQNGSVTLNSVEFSIGSHTLNGSGAFSAGIVTVLSGASVTLTSTHSLSVLVINAGGSFDCTNRMLTLTGAGTAIFNSGAFTATGSTIIYQGAVAQVVTANIAYNNLTINNPAGVSLAGDSTVGGVLNLATDLTTGASTLIMPASGSSIGSGDVIGNTKRTGFTNGAALSFGNPFNTIRFDSGAPPTDVNVNLVKSTPPGFPFNTVSRTYTIIPNGGAGFSATLRLRYKDAELNGLSETTLELWRYNGSSWLSPDVTDPASPVEVSGEVNKQPSGYTVTFAAPETGLRSLLVFVTPERPAIAMNQPSTLRQTNADFIIITRSQFADSLKPLVLLRQRQGLSVALIDAEDIYDEFSFGHKTPHAIRDFLVFTAANSKRKPAFVLFAGDASYDPRNYLGLGDHDFVPARLIDTAYMEAASDDWFADTNDDGLPEIAVGRLPVRSAAEAVAIVNKIIAYEQSHPSGELSLAADTNEGYDFEQASNQLVSLVPAAVKVTRIYRGRLDQAAAKEMLLDGIQRGQKIVNYAGHGSANVWRGNLLTSQDAALLEGTGRYSIFVMMTCLNGYFHSAAGESLAESLMRVENGGAVAVWASSGMTQPGDQALMNQEFYRLVFGGREVSLGDAARKAKAVISDRDIRSTWILLGDPSMRLK